MIALSFPMGIISHKINLQTHSKHSQNKQNTIATMPSFQIQDLVAFITGTNKVRGIGRALVEALIENGAKKIYATARNTSQNRRSCRKIQR
jgi:nucleotidyltransferase/DNA polymerase involved in DNA repair